MTLNSLGQMRPTTVIAEFEDQYGDVRKIHRPKGRRLSVLREGNTPVHAMNRACAILMAKKIKARRLELGLSQKQVCIRAGFELVNPKQRIHAIENATRNEGVRLGTLYALAQALLCEPRDLLPTLAEVLHASGVKIGAGEAGLWL